MVIFSLDESIFFMINGVGIEMVKVRIFTVYVKVVVCLELVQNFSHLLILSSLSHITNGQDYQKWLLRNPPRSLQSASFLVDSEALL